MKSREVKKVGKRARLLGNEAQGERGSENQQYGQAETQSRKIEVRKIGTDTDKTTHSKGAKGSNERLGKETGKSQGRERIK